MGKNRLAGRPRLVCRECGGWCHPLNSPSIRELRGDEEWIERKLIFGPYCSSDHLLNAYLRGYPRWLHDQKVKK
jgi:hypothetical protein